MSLCCNVFSKVPWSCWYCECYLNDSFESLRTAQHRNTLLRFSIIFILKFLVWVARKKDADQQIAFVWNHPTAAVFCFMGWSQTCASAMFSLDTHTANLDCLQHSWKSMKKYKPLSLIGKRKTIIKHCFLYDACFYSAAIRYSINRRTSHSVHTLSLHTCVYLRGEILAPVKLKFS